MTRRTLGSVRLAAGVALSAVLAVTLTSAPRPAQADGRKVFKNSVIPLPAVGPAPAGLVVNAAVQDHTNDKMDILFSLGIPKDARAKLEEKVLKGEVVDPQSLAKDYSPKAEDVDRFASLGTTEQGQSGTQFRVDYLKPSGAIGFYYPDWAAIQTTAKGDVNWILETKGRAWEDTAAKETAMHDWCERISEATGQIWKHARVNQIDFHDQRPKTLAEAVSKKCLAPTTPLLS